MIHIRGSVIVGAPIGGSALASDIPLSFWGGFDPDTGEIIDQRHPLAGHIAAGRVLVLPAGRGSCSGSGVLLEAIRNETAPAAILTSRLDPIISLGAILGDELYHAAPTILVIPDDTRRQITTGDLITIANDGWLSITPRTATPRESESDQRSNPCSEIPPLPAHWERGAGR